MCQHNTCKNIRSYRANNNKTSEGGVGVILLNNYYNCNKYAVLLGKEKGGRYAGEYNLCAGSVEKCDNSCYIATARREMLEEFKLDLHKSSDFDKVFKNSSGKVRYIMHNSNPVFIGVISGIKRKDLNDKIKKDNSNTKLSHSLREMDNVDYFWLNGTQIENNVHSVSSFASSVMNRIDVKKL